MIARPNSTEYAPFYAGYVASVPEGDVLAFLEKQIPEIEALAAGVPPGRETFRYADGKWSVREVLGHLQDCERVMGHRAFCISRDEATPLPGFDENLFVERSGYDTRPLAALVAEWRAVRESNLHLLRQLDAQAWTRLGMANNVPVSVRALAWIIAGHVEHHRAILRARYDVSPPAGRKGAA